MMSNKKCVEGLEMLAKNFFEKKNRHILLNAARKIQIQQRTIRLMAERIKDEVDHFEFPRQHPSLRASE